MGVSFPELRALRQDACPVRRKPLSATVCIPWRPSPSRMPAYTRVRAFWAEHFPNWPVITADSDTAIFSLSRARNAAVAQATTPVVVVADADTLPTPGNITKAVADPVGVCWPFTHYRVLAPEYVNTALDELAAVPCLNAWGGDGVAGVGGCLVTTTKEYWRLGGQPPEFIGWGHEETAFTYIVEALSTPKRIKGDIYAFEHNTGSIDGYIGAKADSPGWDRDLARNEAQMGVYRRARGRAWLMRELIKARTGVDPLGDAPNVGNVATVGRYQP
jgi:hypothetical protein